MAHPPIHSTHSYQPCYLSNLLEDNQKPIIKTNLWKDLPWNWKACSNSTLSSTDHSSGKGVKLARSWTALSKSCLCQKSIPRACSALYPYFSLEIWMYSSTAKEKAFSHTLYFQNKFFLFWTYVLRSWYAATATTRGGLSRDIALSGALRRGGRSIRFIGHRKKVKSGIVPGYTQRHFIRLRNIIITRLFAVTRNTHGFPRCRTELRPGSLFPPWWCPPSLHPSCPRGLCHHERSAPTPTSSHCRHRCRWRKRRRCCGRPGCSRRGTPWWGRWAGARFTSLTGAATGKAATGWCCLDCLVGWRRARKGAVDAPKVATRDTPKDDRLSTAMNQKYCPLHDRGLPWLKKSLPSELWS